jgi:hypothetical protein
MVRTFQGREIDMEKLTKANELMPAIGNMRVNARGDKLGTGGKIIQSRDEVIAEYYEDPPELWPQQPPRPPATASADETSPTSKVTKKSETK